MARPRRKKSTSRRPMNLVRPRLRWKTPWPGNRRRSSWYRLGNWMKRSRSSSNVSLIQNLKIYLTWFHSRPDRDPKIRQGLISPHLQGLSETPHKQNVTQNPARDFDQNPGILLVFRVRPVPDPDQFPVKRPWVVLWQVEKSEEGFLLPPDGGQSAPTARVWERWIDLSQHLQGVPAIPEVRSTILVWIKIDTRRPWYTPKKPIRDSWIWRRDSWIRGTQWRNMKRRCSREFLKPWRSVSIIQESQRSDSAGCHVPWSR